MQTVPKATVICVQYQESGCRRVEVDCPYCYGNHWHEWPMEYDMPLLRESGCSPAQNKFADFERLVPVSEATVYRLVIPDWAQDSRFRTGYAKRNFDEAHTLVDADLLNALHDEEKASDE